MGNDGQGAVLSGEVQAVKQGSGIFIDTDGTISVDASSVVGLVKLNSGSAFNGYVWPNTAGTQGQVLTKGVGNALEWTNGGVFVSGSAPLNPEIGDLWFNCNVGELLVYESCTTGAPQWSGSSIGLPILPGNTSASPGFVSGSGTLVDPYICTATVASSGGVAQILQTVQVNDLAPFQFVQIVDLNAATNGGRFSFTNNVANSSGILTFDIIFTDNPPSATGATYTANIRVGSSSAYVRAGVSVTNAFIITSPGSISGNTEVGSTLTYNVGSTTGGAPPIATSWVWKNDPAGATLQTGGSTYETESSDFGSTIFVIFTATDASGSSVSDATPLFGPISKPPFPNPTPPEIPTNATSTSCFAWDGAATTLSSDDCLVFNKNGGAYSQGPTTVNPADIICTKFTDTVPGTCADAPTGTEVFGCLFDTNFSTCGSLTIDRVPGPFSFVPATSITPGQLATSAAVTISQTNATSYITRGASSDGSDWEVNVNGSGFVTLPLTGGVPINPGQSFVVRFRTGAGTEVTYNLIVQIGEGTQFATSTFAATTSTPGFPTTPISFPTATAGSGSVATSVAWGNGTTDLTATGCIEFSLDGGSTWLTGPNQIINGVQLKTRYKSTSICGNAPTNTTITGSITNLTFTESGQLQVDRVPAAYSFGPIFDAASSQPVNSDIITPGTYNSTAYVTLVSATLTSVSAYIDGVGPTLIPASGTTLPINPGQTLQLRGTTGPGLVTEYTATIAIGESTNTQNSTWSVTTANLVPSITQPTIDLPVTGTQNINPATNIPPGIAYVGSTYNPSNGASAHTTSDWEAFTNTGVIITAPRSSAITNTASATSPVKVQAPFKLMQTGNVVNVSGGNILTFATSSFISEFTPGTLIQQAGGFGTVVSNNVASKTITVGSITGTFVSGLPCLNSIQMDQAQSAQLVNNGITLSSVTDPTANSWGITSAASSFSAGSNIQIPARSALGGQWTIDFFVKSTLITFNASGGLIIPSATTGNGYNYHVFTTNGTFTTNNPYPMDILLVGGGQAGQSGGNNSQAGAAGGGVLFKPNYTLGAGAYPVNVGLGGAGLPAPLPAGPSYFQPGGDTFLGTELRAFGGGGGANAASPTTRPPALGGSGSGLLGTGPGGFGVNPTTPAALGGPYPAAETQGGNGGSNPFPSSVPIFQQGGTGGGGAGGPGGDLSFPGQGPGTGGGPGRAVPQFPSTILLPVLPGVPAPAIGTGIFGGGGGGGGGNGEPAGSPAGGGPGGGGLGTNFLGAAGSTTGSITTGGKGLFALRYVDPLQTFWSWTGGSFSQLLNQYAWNGTTIGVIDGEWHHIRVTNNEIYFDGVAKGVASPAKPNLAAVSFLGNSATGINPINGQIGPFRVLDGVNLGAPPADPGDIFSPANSGLYPVTTSTTITLTDSTNLNLFQPDDIVVEVGGSSSGIITSVSVGLNQVTVSGSSTWTIGNVLEDTSQGVSFPKSGLQSSNAITSVGGGGSTLSISGADVNGFVVGDFVSNGEIGASAAEGTIVAISSTSVSVTPADANWTIGEFLYRGSPVVINLNDSVNLESYVLPMNLLNPSTGYSTRVRYKASNATSPYSNWNTVTTASAFTPTIGAPYGGGYFAGQIVVFEGSSPVTYNLIISDGTNSVLHNTTGLAWRTSNVAESATNVFQNLVNGNVISNFALSNGYNSATYPVWQFVQAARSAAPGGYNDWYLPSAAELALIYQNFKPTTTNNNTSARTAQSNASILNGEGSWNTVMGNNQSSGSGGLAFTIPAFTGFTSLNPGQTGFLFFRTGNTQAMTSGATEYWSATESSASTGSVWGQLFDTGQQQTVLKNVTKNVRLVRREQAQ
jgi:hypothetical protein